MKPGLSDVIPRTEKECIVKHGRMRKYSAIGMASGRRHSQDRVSPRATAVVPLKFKSIRDGEEVLEADGGSFKWLMSGQ